MSDCIWIHEDALRRSHPVFSAAAPDARAIFIWDDAYFKTQNYSLKRLVFIFEALVDMDAKIIAGDTKTVLEALNPAVIYLAKTPNPFIRDILNQCQSDHVFKVIADVPFVRLDNQPDMKRFFRYWKKAKTSAMTSTGPAATQPIGDKL